MNKIGIIGYGEIGKGLDSVYRNNNLTPAIFDPYLDIEQDLKNCDFLNICIPYTEKFIEIVQNYINTFEPKLTIIHSTVAPNTTKKIIGSVIHSPVRGLHPNLDTGIQTFVKYIGSEHVELSYIYKAHLDSLGISSYICKNSLTTEYAKLLDTTYYGLCIAFHNEVNQICDKNLLDFDEVMTVYNTTYNDGYSKLNKNNVIRPVLKAGGKIGGHCVIPNLEILNSHFQSKLFDGILKFK